MKTRLTGARVIRAGVTARYSTIEHTSVDLENLSPGDGVRNLFTLASKGGGHTQVEYIYGAEDYKPHLLAMLKNDANAALVAMADVMHEHMKKLAAMEDAAAKAARAEIVQTANKRWHEADGTDEAVAQIVLNGIREIVATVERADKKD